MRTIAIGDIHGCLKPLEKMLDVIDPAASDTLVFLGDYVDRGPDSRGVIDCLISLSARCKTVFLRGNHDMVMQQWCEGFIESELWESIGGATTLASYDFPEPRYFPINHLHFLRRCCNYYETDTHIFVHANYHPDLPIGKTSLECLMWTHLGWPIPRPHVSGKTVIVGHTAQTLGLVADFGHLICIDTYCFGGGNLTAYDTGAKTALQIDAQGNLVRDWNGVRPRGWLHKMVDWFAMPRTKYRRKSRMATQGQNNACEQRAACEQPEVCEKSVAKQLDSV